MGNNPNKDVKVYWFQKSFRVPFYPTGLAFERYETGVLFSEMLKRFSQEKYEEGWKREYLNKIHKKGERYQRISY